MVQPKWFVMGLLLQSKWLVLSLLVLSPACRPTCKELKAEARELMEENTACDVDADCKDGPWAHCFEPCGSAVNREADVDAMQAHLQSLADDFKERECGCPTPGCVDPERLRTACVEHRCKLVHIPP